MAENEERRAANGKSRKSRITLGGASTPIAILISYGVTDLWGHQMSQEVAIALATVIGSLTSVASVCFWDLRAIVLGHLRRRAVDRKR
jgi:hypothetical protein